MKIPIHPVGTRLQPRAPAPADAPVAAAPRRLRIRVLRFNPQEPSVAPHWQTYELVDAAGMTLFIALGEIREKLDPSLQFDFVCRAGICGSCAMLVDGRRRWPAAR
jgi:fumarate reductase iron-sulfur subunit